MFKLLVGIIKTSRPRQWIKNLAIFASLIFSGSLFEQDLFRKTIWGFVLLSLLVSSIYFINDLADREKDRLHPFKKKRPIACGIIPVHLAVFLAIVGVTVALAGATMLSNFFFLALFSYLLLQLAYTFRLKEIVILDILAIAGGFILRIYAGAFLIDAHLSVWFLLCVISVSLFLAAGKRRAELTLLAETVAAKHRKSLSRYSPELLDSYLAMFATASWMSWALFTFFTEEERDFYISRAISPGLLGSLPLTILGSGKLLMVTIPFVIFGIMRYLEVVYTGARAETPERVIISDKQLLATVFVWGALVLVIMYGLRYQAF